jgi:hypothetical protein
MSNSENYPLKVDREGNINIKILKATEVYKNDTWWKIVALCEDYGKKKVIVFQWMKDKKGKWQEKQKYSEKGFREWNTVKPAIDEYLKECQ